MQSKTYSKNNFKFITKFQVILLIFFNFLFSDEKLTHMVGSYAPKLEMQSYSTPVDEMPSGFVARGNYTVKSLFTDDDKNEHLKWEWSFELKKDWE